MPFATNSFLKNKRVSFWIQLIYLNITNTCLTIAYLLSIIANLSLEQGVFPEELKFPFVTPTHKTKNPILFNDYHTISLPSMLLKILERLVYKCLLKFLNKHNFFNKF